MLKVKLCSIDQKLVELWEKEFTGYSGIEIIQGDIFQQKADTITSPGNSFGLMDAGLDKLMCDYLGDSLEQRLQQKIKKDYYGELPVGMAIILETNNERFPYFISSPTMRVSMRLENSANVYLATRAVFISINEFNNMNHLINSVIIPGMGIDRGKVPYEIAAKQMKVAYDAIILNKTIFPKDWKIAKEAHDRLIK